MLDYHFCPIYYSWKEIISNAIFCGESKGVLRELFWDRQRMQNHSRAFHRHRLAFVRTGHWKNRRNECSFGFEGPSMTKTLLFVPRFVSPSLLTGGKKFKLQKWGDHWKFSSDKLIIKGFSVGWRRTGCFKTNDSENWRLQKGHLRSGSCEVHCEHRTCKQGNSVFLAFEIHISQIDPSMSLLRSSVALILAVSSRFIWSSCWSPSMAHLHMSLLCMSHQ